MAAERHSGGTTPRADRIATGKSESRSKLIGAIRAAAQRKGMDEDQRRDLIERVTGKRSAGDLTMPELGRVLDEMNRDWKNAEPHRSHIGKVRALWWTLFWLGEVDESNDRTIGAFVKRQTGIAALRFLDHRQAPSVIEALKAMATRAGVEWPKPEVLAVHMRNTPGYNHALAERHAVLEAIWVRLAAYGATKSPSYTALVRSSLKLPVNHHLWSRHDLDAAIKMLGKWLRGLQAAERCESREAQDVETA